MITIETLREEMGEEKNSPKVEQTYNAVPITDDGKKFYQKPFFWILVAAGIGGAAYWIIKKKKGNAPTISDIQ